MKDKFGIKGKVEYELRDVDGNLKDSGTIPNTITALMDAHVADQMSDSTDSQIGYIALGTGTGETSASTDLATYSAGTFLGLSGTATQGTAGADNDVVYSGYWAAGVGTASLTEEGIFLGRASARSDMMTYNDGLTVTKGASDTLKIDWTVTFGAS